MNHNIRLDLIRKAVMVALRGDDAKVKRAVESGTNPWYYTLPADLCTHPGQVLRIPAQHGPSHATYLIKVLSSEDAKRTSKTGANKPHRLLIWDEVCKKWQFAGKYVQHRKSRGHQEMKLTYRNKSV